MVWLKQLLLLLSRIAVLLLGLFLLAQVGCHDDRISKLLGGSTTHHYILLDDSFSMSDRNDTGSAFNRARETLSLIAARVKNRHNQNVTLIRYSSARRASVDPADREAAYQEDVSAPTNASPVEHSPILVTDFNGELVDDLFEQKMENLKSTMAVSNLAIEIDEAARIVKQLIVGRENEGSIVYVISDFRQRDWENPEFAASQFREIHESGAAVELIRCVSEERINLAITSLSPAGNVRVAGTPLMMKVVVRNCSSVAAEKVQLKISTIPIPSAAKGESVASRVSELPMIFIQSIPPGESVTQQFPVYFESTGRHIVFADLPDDAVQVDNPPLVDN